MPELRLNLGYLMTKPGMLKAIAVVAGVVALAMTAAAFNEATYYNPECTSDQTDSYEQSLQQQIQSQFQNLSNPQSVKLTHCEQIVLRTYDYCVHIRAFYELQFVKDQIAKLTPEEKEDALLKPCPEKALVVAPLVLIFVVWFASLILLVFQLVMVNPAGFMKILFGMLGMGVTSAAYFKGAYFNLLEIYCRQEQVVKIREDKAAGKDAPDPKSCPPGWMVHLAVIFVGVALFLTIVFLFATLLFEKRRAKLLKRIDFHVQYVAVGFYLFSALLLLIFQGMMMESDWWDCAYDPLKSQYHVDVDSSTKRILAALPGNCEARRIHVFRHDLLEHGLNMMGAAGLASFCTAVLIHSLWIYEADVEQEMIQGERIPPTNDTSMLSLAEDTRAVRDYNDRLNNNVSGIPVILSQPTIFIGHHDSN